jgi:hypothetical protein
LCANPPADLSASAAELSLLAYGVNGLLFILFLALPGRDLHDAHRVADHVGGALLTSSGHHS